MKFFNSFFLAKTVKTRLSTFEWLFWAAFAVYYPMVVVYLRFKGYSNTTIGTILAVNSFMVIIAQPFWGMVCDYIRSIKKVFILCFSLTICLFVTLPLYKTALLTGIAFAAITFFESGMMPLLDSWVINKVKKEKNLHYGSIRMYGSLGFAISVTIVTAVIDRTSMYIIFPAFALSGIMVILWSLQIKDGIELAHTKVKSINILPLLKNREYMLFLIFSPILFAPFRAAFFFLANAMEELGGSQMEYGIAFAVTALSEVPVFMLSVYLVKRFKSSTIILIASVFFILRQLILIMAETPLQLIFAQATQGLTFGMFLTGTVYYVDKLAPDNLKSTAQTLATAVYYGLGGVLGSYWGGWAIDNIGLKSMYKIGFAVSIGITFFFLLTLIYSRTRENKIYSYNSVKQ